MHDHFYKGYVKTKNKKAIEKFKNASLRTLEETANLSEFAGVLNENAILIDVDSSEESQLLYRLIQEQEIKCRVVKTTRGMHFLFYNSSIDKCYTNTPLAVGIHADIKVGIKNSYEILKHDGVERQIIYDTEEYETIPPFLYPIKSSIDFLNMENGDGRNSALFSYILTLQKYGLGVEDVKHCIHLINQYIVSEPLPSDEIDTILRDDAFVKPIFYNGRTFLFDKFAKFIQEKYHIKRINNQLHVYENGIYINGMNIIESLMIDHIPELSQAKRREVLAYLEILVRHNSETANANMIAFKNGIYDIEEETLLPFSPDIVITNKIPWNYQKGAYHELMDNTLNKMACHDKEIRNLLEECIGYCMFRRNELGKAFFLTGEGSNGKSTFMNVIKHLLGRDNYSVLDVKKLGDRFSTVMLFGKLANIGDDISSEYISDVSDFRKIVTGETIDAEQKGQPKFQFNPYVKLIFSANNVPRMGKGKDFAAIKRRLVVIPFNARFSPTDADFVPYIFDKLKTPDAMEYLIQVGVAGLLRVLETYTFTKSEKADEQLREYEEFANPLVGFLREYDEDIINQSISKVYQDYKNFCFENNLNHLGRSMFTKQVNKELGLISKTAKVNGRLIRIFQK